jgi:CRISPR system Cascade subunit CasC
MKQTFIDIHILQTVPPSNINRDDSGSPKTAVYGGVRRARVSSQAWKRATRVAFNEKLDPSEVGVRTKRVVGLLAEEIEAAAPQLAEHAIELATETIKAVGIEVKAPKKGELEEAGYLVFLSRCQVRNLAAAAIEAAATDDVKKALKDSKVKDLADRDHSVDIALFGRMVADQADINVDATVQVAHAISVHPVEPEFDYYTAVDDYQDDDKTGAGMIGTVEFNSATLYRYATVNVPKLYENLGTIEATRRAVEVFIESFVRSMPTGKQNTFANRTLPEAVVVLARDSQPINLVGAFENPVRETLTTGRSKLAADALRDEAQDVERAYGEQPIFGWVTRLGEDVASLDELGTNVPLRQLIEQVGELVASRGEEQA